MKIDNNKRALSSHFVAWLDLRQPNEELVRAEGRHQVGAKLKEKRCGYESNSR